jgi:hypothetical protein
MVGIAALAFVPGSEPTIEARGQSKPPKFQPPDVTSLAPLAKPVDLLFIHHSVGGALLAEPGAQSGELAGVAIYDTHPAGAGVRSQLTQLGYRVHDASYNSKIGDGIDMFDWLPKFRDDMELVQTTRLQDQRLPEGERNQIVMFETCYNSNRFEPEDSEPGNPRGPELTVANAKAVFRELREELAKHPETLFVHITASPVQSRYRAEPLWKAAARLVLGKPQYEQKVRVGAERAREFNTWLADPNGWLKGYPHDNVLVFNQYDLLTNYGKSDGLVYSADPEGYDPHPSAEGQREVARALVPLIHQAVTARGLDSK